MSSEQCLKARCSVVFHPHCPADSRLLIPPPPPGECCGQPGTCVCDLQKCKASVPVCEAGKELTLVEEGRGEPEKCCDVFECRKQEAHCANTPCPLRVLDEDEGVEECPPDSIRPPTHVPNGACCPIRPACRCRASVCRPATCPDGQTLRIVSKGTGSPGRCCDDWTCDAGAPPMTKECKSDGKTHEDGEEWFSASCASCKCIKGVAQCKGMDCPKLPEHCSWIGIPEGECCPVCFGCKTDANETKKRNETWKKDNCVQCSCSDSGMVICEEQVCKTDCENPKKVEGQCCPVCDEPSIITLPDSCPSLEHCPLRCENGLRRDARGCFECECLPVEKPTGAENCEDLSAENCDKQCAHGYSKDASGCAVCKCAKCPPLHQCFKHCLYGFETNAIGCPVCKCRGKGSTELKQLAQEKMNGAFDKDKCISTSSNGRQIERDAGEWWNDGCRHCFCEQRQEFCSLISCPSKPPECPQENWKHKDDGSCCPTCTTLTTPKNITKHQHTVCQSPGTGRLFTDGETWQLASCVSCTCRVGQVLCRTVECPPVACENPAMTYEDTCCPRCPNNTSVEAPRPESPICTDESGTVHVAGSSWRTDECTSCTCTKEGKTACYREECPVDEQFNCKGSPLVIKGRCCPVCSDVLSSSAVCSYQSSVYSVGEQWQEGACSNCSCVAGGQTICRQMVCPPCEDIVPLEGHCCPLCKDHGWQAAYALGNTSSVSIESNDLLGRQSNRSTIGGNASASAAASGVLPMLGLSLMVVAIIGLLILLFILYKRSRKHNKMHRMSRDPSVRLSGSKPIGSMPQLVDWHPSANIAQSTHSSSTSSSSRRRDSHSDGQSDSLLSTTSDSSSVPSSASSGHGPHADTQPLTLTGDSLNVSSSRTKRFPV
ncbi:hypothetical protein WR25_13594 [Diploscapter pachys]|uniref:VWFC domain-containing protein n=1 Tax=Diploscapter pachys TaxID=2018661 RepID=A0A2A2KMB7_9BILA|nr:hypothetical protein WR25_13594 [Diploscapter pachys]